MTQHNGTIKYANAEKRFGFITPDSDQPAVYFAFDQLRGSASRTPRKGEPVVYEVGTGTRGQGKKSQKDSTYFTKTS